MLRQNNHLLNSLVLAGPQEEALPGTFGAAAPLMGIMPDTTNYAEDEDVAAFVQGELHQIILQTRRDRQVLHDEWDGIRAMNLMKHDAGRRYFGRSDQYLPVYRKSRQGLISALSKGLFPSDEYFDVTDRDTSDPEEAWPLKAYMRWEFDRVAKVRTHMKRFLGQLVDYGTSPLKYWYRKDVKSVGRAKRGAKSAFGGQQVDYGFGNKPITEGLAISARSLHYWYLYPTTVDSLDQASIIFEDIDESFSFLKAMKDSGRWVNTDKVYELHSHPEHAERVNAMLAARGGLPVPGPGLGDKGRVVTLTEIWTSMILPRKAYLPHEDPSQPLPVRIVMSYGIPMEVVRNPFFHQRPPYLCARLDAESGFFYGTGAGRTVRPLQLLANDFMNQTNDCGIYGLNPIAVINPGLMLGPPKPLAPGVPFYTQDINAGIRFDRPPIDQVQMGQQMSNMIIGMAQDFGGAPPFTLPGGGMAGKGGKTATGASILQRNAMQPLQDVVEDIENEVMVELLCGAHVNAQQYREEDVMVAIAGRSIRVSPADLAIDAEWSWLASSQAVNNQVRAQQAIQLMQAVLPAVPLLLQQGKVVDFESLIKKVFVDGMGFRGFHEFIRPAQVGPGGQPGMGLPPDQMAAAGQEQGDRMRSALEQVYGAGGAEAQPGEADDFAAVRSEADDMAAMMGGGGEGGMM